MGEGVRRTGEGRFMESREVKRGTETAFTGRMWR
jgi:hypothetical protein